MAETGTRTPPASTRADWRRSLELYGQLSEFATMAEEAVGPPDDLAGSLAETVARVFANYEGDERMFIDDLFALWCERDGRTGSAKNRFNYLYVDERFDRFLEYHPLHGVRRRPKPFEAVVETVRRIIDLNEIRDVAESLPSSAILGGSVSYGRFYNVCGGFERPSDLDLIVVLETYDALPELVRLLGDCRAIEGESLEDMEVRSRAFLAGRPSGQCAFAHKLRMWSPPNSDPIVAQYDIPSSYQLNIHVCDAADFRYLILADVPTISDADADIFPRVWREFRDDQPRGAEEQRAFSGRRRFVEVDVEMVEGGMVAASDAADVVDGRFFPGVAMNLILPQFEVRWESPSVRLRLALLNLRWKLVERLADERAERSAEHQRLSLAHVRSYLFAPHVKRRVDRVF